MNLVIENFRGIKHAAIQLSNKITLFEGPVGSGKSSVIQAIQALVTGNALPMDGLKKKDAAILVNDQEKTGKGKATLVWDGGNAEIKWPSCKAVGTTFKCSSYAAGLLLPTSIPSKDLGAILGILPDFNDFKEFISIGIEHMTPDVQEQIINQIWNKIQSSSWDSALAQAEEKGRDGKRDWEKLSGENWSGPRACTFQPSEFTGKSIEDLQQALATAEKLYEHAIKSAALGEKEHDDLLKLAANLEPATVKVDELTHQLAELQQELSKAQSLLEVIPRVIATQEVVRCGSCHFKGVVQSGVLAPGVDMAALHAEADAVRSRVAEQNQTISNIQQRRDSINMALRMAKSDLDSSKAAQKKVQSVVVDSEPVMSVDDARVEVGLCRRRITADKVKTECDEIAEMLQLNTYIKSVLHPESLRKHVLAKKLETFNQLMAEICEIAEWPAISFDEYLDVRAFGNRPYVALSTGQKFAVNAAMQVALTKMDGSQIIIVDEFQQLGDLRDGLIFVLEALKLPAVLGSSCVKPGHFPADVGVGYWCEGGVVQLASQMVPA